MGRSAVTFRGTKTLRISLSGVRTLIRRLSVFKRQSYPPAGRVTYIQAAGLPEYLDLAHPKEPGAGEDIRGIALLLRFHSPSRGTECPAKPYTKNHPLSEWRWEV